jgi:hypothetical protein
MGQRAVRASIPHPLAKRLPSRRNRRGRQAEPAHAANPTSPTDPAVQRVRHAGGPTDRASYTCQCGYMFLAPVSTTVACPHCRAPQAW